MAYIAYENYSFVIRENTGSTRILAGLIIEGTSDSSHASFTDILTAVNEYVANHATYEAINPLWIGITYYNSEPTGAPSGYVCVWEEYISGSSSSLNDAIGKIKRASYQYYRAALIASSEGGIAYAKDFFDHCLPQTQTQQLDTPTDLTATNVTKNSADLGWSNVENASNYRVDYRIYGDTLWQQTTSN